jgi:KDO2-lipid IV(A) lauroyltransferase
MVLAHGYPVALPVEVATSEFQRSVNRARGGAGLHLINTDSALGIFRFLREGKVLAMLADRAVTGVGEEVEFFGRPALLPSAAVVLSMRTGAPLVPCFAGPNRWPPHRDVRAAARDPEYRGPQRRRSRRSAAVRAHS